MTKIVTWNVNSINARLDRLLAFLGRESPDYLCLQELKCTEDNYPFEAITKVGYQSAVFGQKTYNGVAILTKKPVTVSAKNFGDGHSDDSARFLSVESDGLTVISAYIPNGQSVGSEKYLYKLEWLSRAKQFLEQNYKQSDKIVLVGDFNVAPDDRDVHDPRAWYEQILCSTKERQALAALVSFGFVDTLRMHHGDEKIFTWWDYRELSFVKNKGLRIDMIYATPSMAMRCTSVRVDRDERKGEKPSDHAPVIAEFRN